MKNYVGAKVQSIRDGVVAEVFEQDSLTMVLKVQDKKKAITHNTFNRWWKVIIESKPKEEELIDRTKDNKVDPNVDSWGRPIGDKGVGVVLRDKFAAMLRDYDDNADILIFHDPEKKKDTVRYKGSVIFECYFAVRRFSIYARYDSLTPMNKDKVVSVCPKEWGWTLTAKFVFTDMTQWPLMKSIISDALFYENNKQKDY